LVSGSQSGVENPKKKQTRRSRVAGSRGDAGRRKESGFLLNWAISGLSGSKRKAGLKHLVFVELSADMQSAIKGEVCTFPGAQGS